MYQQRSPDIESSLLIQEERPPICGLSLRGRRWIAGLSTLWSIELLAVIISCSTGDPFWQIQIGCQWAALGLIILSALTGFWMSCPFPPSPGACHSGIYSSPCNLNLQGKILLWVTLWMWTCVAVLLAFLMAMRCDGLSPGCRRLAASFSVLAVASVALSIFTSVGIFCRCCYDRFHLQPYELPT